MNSRIEQIPMRHQKAKWLGLTMCLALSSPAHAVVNVFGGGGPVHFAPSGPNSGVFSGGVMTYGSPFNPSVIDAPRVVLIDRSGVPSQLQGSSIVVGAPDPFFPTPRPLPFGSTATLAVDGGGPSPGVTTVTALGGGVQIGADAKGIVNAYNNAILNVTGTSRVASANYGELNLSSGAIFNQTSGNIIIGTTAAPSTFQGPWVGQVNLSSNSRLNVTGANSFIGVGWDGTQSLASASRLVVNNSDVFGNVVIGANSLLGGTGTIHGNITNYGTINPGNSPGTLYIDGSLTNAPSGKIIIEIQSNGAGGYNTDKIVFSNTNNLGQLANTPVTFALGAGINPDAYFGSSSFTLDSFFFAGTSNGFVPISTVADDVTVLGFFNAAAFQYTTPTNSQATLLAAASVQNFLSPVNEVPAPATLMLLVPGLLALRIRRQKRAASKVLS